MEIVSMKEEHLSEIARLEKICFKRPWNEKALRDELENPLAYFFTAVDGMVVLGYGGMQYACGTGYIDNIAVFPMCRKRGVATALLHALEKKVRERGGNSLTLEVRLSNLPAISLYKKLGFREVGLRKKYYTAPREDALIFTKEW